MREEELGRRSAGEVEGRMIGEEQRRRGDAFRPFVLEEYHHPGWEKNVPG